MVVETMMREKLSYREAAKQFNVADHKDVARWERYYLAEGPESLYVERRGRGSKGHPQQFPKEVEEDLLAEVQRLRAENAYLKKLHALVQERERHKGKSNGDSGTEAGTRSEIAVGNRSNPKSNLLLPRKAHGSGG